MEYLTGYTIKPYLVTPLQMERILKYNLISKRVRLMDILMIRLQGLAPLLG